MQLKPEINQALHLLHEHHLVQLNAGQYYSTRRWQGAMARAAFQLMQQEETLPDIRIPITHALESIFSGKISETQLVDLVAAMLLVQANELSRLDIHSKIELPYLYY